MLLYNVKVSSADDVRVWEGQHETKEGAWAAFSAFVAASYGTGVRMTYVDDEEDTVTVAGAQDFQQAWELAVEGGEQLHIRLVPAPVRAEPEHKEAAASAAATGEEAGEDAQAQGGYAFGGVFAGSPWAAGAGAFQELRAALRDDQELYDEFVSAVVALVMLLQDEPATDLATAVTQVLSAHERLAAHRAVVKIQEMLPAVGGMAQPFLAMMVAGADPGAIAGMVHRAVHGGGEGGDAPHGRPPQDHTIPWMHMLGNMFGGAAAGAGAGNPMAGFCEQMAQFGQQMGDFGQQMGNLGQHMGQQFAQFAQNWAPPPHHGYGPFHGHHHHHDHHGPVAHGHGHGHGQGHHRRHHHHRHAPFGDFRGRAGFRGGRGRGRGWRRHGPQSAFHGGMWGPAMTGAAAADTGAATLHAALVAEDLTLADGAVVLPKQMVVKTWRIKNTGDAAWPEGVTLQYAGEPFNPLVDGVQFPVHALAAGEEGDVSAVMKAPEQAGECRARWQLRDAGGRPFGVDLVCRVVVAGEAMDVDESDASWEHVAGHDQEGQVSSEQAQGGEGEGRVVRPYDLQVAEIRGMGFGNELLIRQLLEQHEGKVDVVVSTLVQLAQ